MKYKIRFEKSIVLVCICISLALNSCVERKTNRDLTNGETTTDNCPTGANLCKEEDTGTGTYKFWKP
jgi:hypothetical protein